LLVRQRERATGLQRSESRAEADRAGDRVEDHIRVHVADELLGFDGAERRVLDLELGGLLGQHLGVAPGRQTDELESARVGADDLEGLGADGAGGAEDDDATHAASLLATAEPAGPGWSRGCR